jgi:8-oxo-dGTP pyrophosphatase MutT (NUDIX family)
VIVAREHNGEFEVLLLKRSEVGAFAGMWVFPGGRVDDTDAGHDEISRAASAAVREASEEVNLTVDSSTLIALSHWTPPAIAPRRFTTWFFVAPWAGDDVVIDRHEIVDFRWIAPAAAITEALPMAPPTYVSLDTLARGASLEGIRALIERRGIERYVTVPADVVEGGLVLLWENDAGYATGDASAPGPRHRLTMSEGNTMRYERTFDEG